MSEEQQEQPQQHNNVVVKAYQLYYMAAREKPFQMGLS